MLSSSEPSFGLSSEYAAIISLISLSFLLYSASLSTSPRESTKPLIKSMI